MLILGIMCLGILLGYLLFSDLHPFWKKANSFLQMGSTLFLIFSMGIILGERENFWQELTNLGLYSLGLAVFPIAGSVLLVMFLSKKAHLTLPCAGGAPSPKSTRSIDYTVFFVLGALLAGIWLGLEKALLSGFRIWAASSSEYALYLLMFTVGISVGSNRPVIRSMRETDWRVLLIPLGIIIGSLLGGAFCSLLNPLGLRENISIGAGMGWYSLSGVLLKELYGPDVGAAAFLSNLFREILTFLLASFCMKKLGAFSGIAMAGATSEDTTLPILMRNSSEAIVLWAVLSGALTSTAVPVLQRLLAFGI